MPVYMIILLRTDETSYANFHLKPRMHDAYANLLDCIKTHWTILTTLRIKEACLHEHLHEHNTFKNLTGAYRTSKCFAITNHLQSIRDEAQLGKITVRSWLIGPYGLGANIEGKRKKMRERRPKEQKWEVVGGGGVWEEWGFEGHITAANGRFFLNLSILSSLNLQL